ncbi:MAG: hypothetical protein PHO02_00640, partial [Candidatus Nanoarchaeia archaeon]|nr:hypothetical protein [Candidatus Nanoarchaeia archaeon]
AAEQTLSKQEDTGILANEVQPNLQLQQKLPEIENKIEELEAQAISEGILTAEQVNALKAGYDSLSDADKLEKLKEMMNQLVDAAQNNGLPEEVANRARQPVRGKSAANAAVQIENKRTNAGFFRSILNAFTGKAIITGRVIGIGDLGDLSPSASGNVLEQQLVRDRTLVLNQEINPIGDLSRIPPDTQQDFERIIRGDPLTAEEKTTYKEILSDMYNEISGLDAQVCDKLKTVTNWERGQSGCTTDTSCGLSGLMVCNRKAGTDYCSFDVTKLCPEKTLLPSGGGLISECSENNECASGSCQMRTTSEGPLHFCWCAANEDCPAEFNCEADTGMCRREGSTADETPAEPEKKEIGEICFSSIGCKTRYCSMPSGGRSGHCASCRTNMDCGDTKDVVCNTKGECESTADATADTGTTIKIRDSLIERTKTIAKDLFVRRVL